MLENWIEKSSPKLVEAGLDFAQTSLRIRL